jgi:hypothetical protein
MPQNKPARKTERLTARITAERAYQLDALARLWGGPVMPLTTAAVIDELIRRAYEAEPAVEKIRVLHEVELTAAAAESEPATAEPVESEGAGSESVGPPGPRPRRPKARRSRKK